MDELAKIMRYLQKNRGLGLTEVRRRLAKSGVEGWRVDYCLEWLQTVSGCRNPEELRARMARSGAQGSWPPYDPGFNLSPEAYTMLVGLRGLGVIGEEDFLDILQRIFRLPDAVDAEELQEILLHDAYGRMLFRGEEIFIGEREQWGNKN